MKDWSGNGPAIQKNVVYTESNDSLQTTRQKYNTNLAQMLPAFRSINPLIAKRDYNQAVLLRQNH